MQVYKGPLGLARKNRAPSDFGTRDVTQAPIFISDSYYNT